MSRRSDRLAARFGDAPRRRALSLRKAAPAWLAMLPSLVSLALFASLPADAAPAEGTVAKSLQQIGRPATKAEVEAWDIDVRGDWKGLPAGSGSVARGADIWDAKCSSCHGAFGESNEVFTPIVGGTSKEDIESGRVRFLSHPGYPHRTTLMRISKLSPLWDYIHRAMPWNQPKSLAADEVYAVLAYVLNLGNIVPADFTLSDKNIAEVEKRLPNRNGKVFYEPMWRVRGKGRRRQPALHERTAPSKAASTLLCPRRHRNAQGNIAQQVRPFGATRGTDTSKPPRTDKVGVGMAVAAPPPAGPSPGQAEGAKLAQANTCTACHGMDHKIVGPAFHDVAEKYAGRADAVAYLTGKIRNGGQGVWGPIPMPAQAQVADAEVNAIARWLAAGAK